MVSIHIYENVNSDWLSDGDDDTFIYVEWWLGRWIRIGCSKQYKDKGEYSEKGRESMDWK